MASQVHECVIGHTIDAIKNEIGGQTRYHFSASSQVGVPGVRREPDASWRFSLDGDIAMVCEVMWAHETLEEMEQKLLNYRGAGINAIVVDLAWRRHKGEASVYNLARQHNEFQRWGQHAAVTVILQDLGEPFWEVYSNQVQPLRLPSGREIRRTDGLVVPLRTDWFVSPLPGEAERSPFFLDGVAEIVAGRLAAHCRVARPRAEQVRASQQQAVKRLQKELRFLKTRKARRLGLQDPPAVGDRRTLAIQEAETLLAQQ